MIRNTVLALNQANLTGNYSVLRDMGTPAFQMTNSQARLAEIFAALRARKLDLSPVMVFNPKLLAPAALQDGQVLKLAGFFPTTPEHVHFELAYQRYGEQWLLAGLAVSVSAPGDGPQASAGGPAGQLMQSALETSAPQTGKPGEAKPIRIDLSKPVQPKKPAAAKKPKPAAQPAQKTAAAQAPTEQPAAAPAQAPAQAEPAEAKPAEKNTGFGAGWNPFGR
jgi:outer membrane biosynthesis protein TonB